MTAVKSSPTKEKPAKTIANLHYYFHVAYYYGLFEEDADKKNDQDAAKKTGGDASKNDLPSHNQRLTEQIFDGRAHNTCRAQWDPFETEFLQSFCLKIQYPGLLSGIGMPHEAGQKGEIANGFSFDYTSGLPVIPGSSVKGTLRSAFEQNGGLVVRDLLAEMNVSNLDMPRLVKSMFGDPIEGKTNTNDDPYRRDVFFDAIIERSERKDCFFLALDTITPHRQTDLLELGEPNPITILKLAPGVVLRFRFKLQDSDLYGQNGRLLGRLKVVQKLELFQRLLCILGIGAKTNVGYGILTAPEEKKG